MDKISELKVAVFDILVAMDELKIKLQKLEELKNEKIIEMNKELEKLPKEANTIEK